MTGQRLASICAVIDWTDIPYYMNYNGNMDFCLLRDFRNNMSMETQRLIRKMPGQDASPSIRALSRWTYYPYAYPSLTKQSRPCFRLGPATK